MTFTANAKHPPREVWLARQALARNPAPMSQSHPAWFWWSDTVRHFPMKFIAFFLASVVLVLPTLLYAQEKLQTPVAAEISIPPAEIPFEKADEFPDSAYNLIAKARVVWLGEMHGTKEAPMLILGLVRLVSRNDQPPIVALEIPAGNQSAIDDYMKTGDENILKSRTFFSAGFHDGRESQAMAKLLLALRTEKIVRLVCFDRATNTQNRDETMALARIFHSPNCCDDHPLALGCSFGGSPPDMAG